MKLTSLAAAALAALALAAVASAGTVNGTDKANAARACSALRSADGTAFSNQYASFGACTSQWVQAAHKARTAAEASCRSQGLTGRKYSACVKAATNTTLATQATASKNAAKACGDELTTLGDAAFAKQYGSKGNLRNAFGKCVSAKVSNKTN